MKRYILIVAAVICGLCSCTKNASDIILDTTQITMCVGESNTLHASVIPSDAANQLVYWTTSDSSVASVSDGTVKALSEGEATITARTDDGGFSATCKITVKLERIQVESISLDKSSVVLYENESDTLSVTFFPGNATEQGLVWTSSDENSVKVIDGIVIAQKAADDDITITASSVDGAKKAECKVKVKCKVAGVILDDVNIAVNEGETYTLKATVYPKRASNTELTWSSADTDIATVDNGLVTGIKAGKTTIAVETVDGGMKYECVVVVRSPVAGMTINHSKVRMYVGASDTLTASILPLNASNKKINWVTDNSDIVDLSADGAKCIVTSKKAGTAYVHAASAEGGFLETCVYTVVKHVTGVSLDVNSKQLYIGSSFDLKATVVPDDAFDKSVEWSSSNSQVATVVNGKVTACGKGEAEITVRTKDGGYASVCHIVVKCTVESASLQESVVLYKGESVDLSKTLQIVPANADYSEIKWICASGVTVNKSGVVTAESTGYSRVIAQIVSDGKTIASNPCDIEIRSHVSSVAFNKKSVSIEQRDVVALDYTVLPEEAFDKSVKLSTPDTDIISIISETGEIYAKAIGEAAVYVETVDGGHKDVCYVTVTKPVTGLSLDLNSLSLSLDKTYAFSATVTPSDLSGVILNWTSSNESVATVSNTGVVTPKALGTTVITVSTANGTHTASCNLTVTDPTVKVKQIMLNKASIDLSINGTFQLIPEIRPSDATDKSVEWSSSDNSVAKVDANGLVTGLSAGTAVITVKAKDGSNVSQSCTVKVSAIPVAGVTVEPSSKTINEKETVQLSVTITPSNAGDKTVTWTSGNTDVATVDASGKVTAVGPGEATITATSKSNPDVYGYCRITVKDSRVHVSSITLSETSKTIEIGKNFTLSATVLPSNASDKTLTWESSNTSVATVDASGKVTAVASGDAVITATSKLDSDKKASCAVKVVNQIVYVTDVTLSQTEIQLYVGESYTLSASVNPYNATNKGIIWDTSVGACVTCVNGKVTAVKEGYANVFAISEGVDSDGDQRRSTCFVTVKKHAVDTIVFDDMSKKVKVGGKMRMKATAYSLENGQFITPSFPGVTWSSSNPSIASINGTTGELTANSVGTVTITATSVDYTSSVVGAIYTKNTCVIEVVDGSVNNGGIESLEFKKLF